MPSQTIISPALDASLAARIPTIPDARPGRDDRHWLLRFARVWYRTHQLKVRRKREYLSDAQYYRMAFAFDHRAPGATGEKVASTRAAVTRVFGRLLDESVHLDEFLGFDLAGRLTRRGFTLLSRAVVWHSVLCLYTFEQTR